MEEEDDDFYAPQEHIPSASTSVTAAEKSHNEPRTEDGHRNRTDQKMTDDLEEGEEEDADESDSDIDIITERKDGSKPEPPPQSSRHNVLRNVPARKHSSDIHQETPASSSRKESSAKAATPVRSGADYPAIRTSKIDVDSVPVYKPAGKPITEIDIDEDLKEHDKPWRVPGSDVSDYFNYGFDEFTWTLYCLKQDKTRAQVQEDKKEFTSGMMMGADGAPSLGLPAIPPLPSNASQPATNLPSLPGLGDIPQEMQAMMAQMIASGIDPGQLAQMDPSIFSMQQAGTGQVTGTPVAQAPAFSNTPPGFAPQGQPQQPMNFGYDSPMMGIDGGRNRPGNFGGRGRAGNRRNW